MATQGCTYGTLSVATMTGNDMFLSVSNTSGATAHIRYRLYRPTGRVSGTFLSVPNGGTRYINRTGYYIVVEYLKSGWSTWKFGCERFG